MNVSTVREFNRECLAFGITPPAAVVRGLELLEVTAGIREDPAASLLNLSDDEARAHVYELSIRRHGEGSKLGMNPGIESFSSALTAEIREASLPELERIVDELRPQFAEVAEPLNIAAQQYGITYRTTSDEIIDRADESAAAAYRAMRSAWHSIQPIVSLRISMSKAFEVSPTIEEVKDTVFPMIWAGSVPNWSVAFAAGESWSLGKGFTIEGKQHGHIDWLQLAKGGLRLNSPEEVRAKIKAHGRALWNAEKSTNPEPDAESVSADVKAGGNYGRIIS